MADIDSLEIEISAESTRAAERVNSLAQSLERLGQAVQNSRLGSISKSIQGLGEASTPAEAKVNKRTQMVRNALEKAGPKTVVPLSNLERVPGLAKLEKQLKGIGAEFDTALDKAERLRTELDISRSMRPISDAEKSQYAAAVQDVERLSQSYHSLKEQIEAIKTGNLGKVFAQAESSVRPIEHIAEKAGTLNQAVKAVGELRLNGPTIDASVQKEIEQTTQQVEELQKASQQIDDTKINIQTEHPFGQAKEMDQSELLRTVNQAFSGTKFGGKVGNITNLAGELGKVSSAASEASAATSGVGAAASGAGAAGASAMASLAGAAGIAVAALEILKQQFNENKEFLQSDRSLWTDTSWDKIAEGATNAAAALMIVHPELKAAVYGIRSFIQPGQELLGVLGQLADSGFRKAGDALKDFASSGFEKAGAAVKSFLSKAKDGIGALGKNLGKQLVSPFTKAFAAIQNGMATLGRMAFYQAINAAVRSVTDGLKEGIDNLYQFSQLADGRFSSAMNSLASSSLYLKNSLGSMAAPLINALAPAIDFIIGKLVSLINIIGTLFAVITGQGSFVQAKKNAVSFGDAVGGAAGAAKELRDYMLGIDELNVISDQSGGGGGGGGGGLDFSDMFEEVELPDWAKDIQDAINKGDWYGAGEILADHLNGIIEKWDSRAWGQKLGEKINNGLEFALGFLRNFDFDQLGQKLANAINGIGDGINFDTLGRVIGAGWNGLFDTIDGFFTAFEWDTWGKRLGQAINGIVDEIHWDKIGKTISDGFIGLFTLLDNAIRTIKWDQLGRSLAEMLNNVDWYGIAYSGLTLILDGIKGAARAIEAFAKAFQWNNVANEIAGGINSALSSMSEREWRNVGNAIGLLFSEGFGFVRDVISGIDWSQLGRDIASMLAGVPWSSLLVNAGGAIAAGLNSIIDTAYEIASKDSFWAKLGDGVYAGVKAFFNDFHIEQALDGLSQAIVNGINLAISGLSGLVQANEFWQNLGAGIRTGISNFFNGIDPGEAVNAISGFLQRVINAGITGISELASHGDWWQELGTAIGNGINDLIQNTDWKALFTGLAKLATDILNGLTAAMKAIDWDEAWRVIKDALDAVDWGPLIDAGLGFFAESFKAKMRVKLFEGQIFFKIGGEILESLWEGLKSVPVLGFFIQLGEDILTVMGDAARLVTAVFSGKWWEIPGIIGDITQDIKEIVTRNSQDTAGAADKSYSEMQRSVREYSEGSRIDTDREWTAAKNKQDELLGIMERNTDTRMGHIAEKTNTTLTAIEADHKTKWGAAQTETKRLLDLMGTGVSTGFEAMKGVVDRSMGSIKTTNETKWGASKTATETALSGMTKANTDEWAQMVTTTTQKAASALKAVTDNFKKVSGEVTGGLTNARTAAKDVEFASVGRNAVEGISSGIRAKVESLKNSMVNGILAAKRAAEAAAGIHSPSTLFRDDVGVYIGLGVAEGITYSTRDIVASIYDVNAQMKEAFDPSILESPQPLEFPVHEDYSRTCRVEYSYDAQHEEDTAQRLSEGVKAGNEGVIEALYAGFAQLLEAVNNQDNQPRVYLDGKEIMQSTERHQRARGANILAGGVMG